MGDLPWHHPLALLWSAQGGTEGGREGDGGKKIGEPPCSWNLHKESTSEQSRVSTIIGRVALDEIDGLDRIATSDVDPLRAGAHVRFGQMALRGFVCCPLPADMAQEPHSAEPGDSFGFGSCGFGGARSEVRADGSHARAQPRSTEGRSLDFRRRGLSGELMWPEGDWDDPIEGFSDLEARSRAYCLIRFQVSSGSDRAPRAQRSYAVSRFPQRERSGGWAGGA
ncbi:hypothetical protein AXG93_136s1130 [Marchantia polymorpha subsp. ruderalis]|uniref:Uncharacterized protein n=1 Tax=Marchantia polymorpha subsp. ruderalis TaxID=1480154 RepID=A0A176W4Z6_MARPO|nr:hypothetical protein AXG93_136s1130 [Marchantia polymorpha subsp. ruderalis]